MNSRSRKFLKLIFGGRLVPMKGVLDLVRVANLLKKKSVPFRMEIYGTGELEQELKSRIQSQNLEQDVIMMGSRDFRTGWIPALINDADLFICCHPQGDPSSTYPEVMSCGVPIVGYENEAFRGVVGYSDGGWVVSMNDFEAMCDIIEHLSANRERIVEAAIRAREFASEHTFEKTFSRRTGAYPENNGDLLNIAVALLPALLNDLPNLIESKPWGREEK